MAAADGVSAAPVGGPDGGGRSVARRLFAEGHAFDFFQAVRLLGRLLPGRRPVGREAPPDAEVVRFRTLASLNFPASTVHEVLPAAGGKPPVLRVTFLGLTGPTGVLPSHYTELLMRLEREAKGPEKRALADWLDLFNHRLIALFYRAWEKYRFPLAYERGEATRAEPDPFTQGVFSLVGLGMPGLRGRLRVSAPPDVPGGGERVLARVEDLALLYYAGLLAHRPRTAAGLEALLGDYFGLPVCVRQLQEQWLILEPASQSRLGEAGRSEVGTTLVVGERVWDAQSKFRVRLGPLRYREFLAFLPDRTAVAERKAFFVLAHLVRLYAGPELDFDVQLVLSAAEVPACRLAEGERPGPRLGWNTWVGSGPRADDAEDAVFEGEERVWARDPA